MSCWGLRERHTGSADKGSRPVRTKAPGSRVSSRALPESPLPCNAACETGIAVDHETPSVTPLTGPCFCGTQDQRQAIQKLEAFGWTFLHWTEVPSMVAVMENATGDIAFIDQKGRAWTGPGFSKVNPCR